MAEKLNTYLVYCEKKQVQEEEAGVLFLQTIFLGYHIYLAI